MKRNSALIGLLLVFLLAGSSCHNERQGMRDMRNSAKFMWMKMGQNFRHKRGMHGMCGMMHQGMRNRMMRGIRPEMGFGIWRGMHPGMRSGMMKDMRRMPADSTGWMPMAPGRRMMETIPNLTEIQKKQIEDFTKKQMDEMRKVREEMFSKMEVIRDSHRKDILNILTDEQKKFVESRHGRLSPVPGKVN